MIILFKHKRLEKECNEYRLLVKRFGAPQATKITARLTDLRASPALETMRSLPGRCHELSGNLKGLLALDVVHPFQIGRASCRERVCQYV